MKDAQRRRTTRLGDHLQIKHGYAFKGAHFADHGPFVVLTPGNFFDKGGFKHKDQEKFYTGEVPEGYLLRRGDLLLAMTEQAEGLLGSAALIPLDDLYLHNQRLGLVVALDEDSLDKHFLYYLFNTYNVRHQIRATATGTKVRHTSPSRIAEVEVDLPTLTAQRRIAAILSAYDNLIANNTRRIAILEEMARAIYREWFVEFRFPGHEQVEMVDSELGPVPEGWEVVSLSEIAGLRRDNVQPKAHPNETFAHFSIPAYDTGQRPALEDGATIRSNKYLVGPEVVLLSKLNPRIPRVWLPTPPSDRRAICSTEFLVLEPESGCRSFLYHLLASRSFIDRLAGRAGGTSTSHQRVKPVDVLGMPVIVPRRQLIGKFTAVADPMLALIETLRSQSGNLRQTRDLLLPKLISGEIAVSEVEEKMAIHA